LFFRSSFFRSSLVVVTIHIMRITTSVFSLLLLCTCALAQTDAKTNFSQKCAVCHGPDGKAGVPMAKKMGALDLTSPPIQKLSDVEIRKTITEGKGKMPPYGGILGKDGVDAMVKYIRSLGSASK
jgi:mono/diheme cytochrome c family protein